MDVELSARELVAAARRAGVGLPFPFVDLSATAALREPESGDSHPAPEPILAAIAAPGRTIYAVLADAAGTVTARVAAIESRTGQCLGLAVIGDRVRLRQIDQQELVQSVVESIAATGDLSVEPLFSREQVVPRPVIASADPQTVADAMRLSRLPEREVQAWLTAGRLRASGLIGAIDHRQPTQRHVGRSVSWRTYVGGGVLVVEQPRRTFRDAEVSLQVLSARTLTRAALDLLTSLNAQTDARAERFAASASR